MCNSDVSMRYVIAQILWQCFACALDGDLAVAVGQYSKMTTEGQGGTLRADVTDIQIASRALLPLLCLHALNARTLALLVASWGMSSKRTL